MTIYGWVPLDSIRDHYSPAMPVLARADWTAERELTIYLEYVGTPFAEISRLHVDDDVVRW